ncbi:early iridovirus protein [Lymphocystis disease virus 1]|uniref:early iridovirus protein n=1 Tax=Fish lymphocystis disease virus TaxID=36363 RepID=UPI0000161ECD|nr:early iridovirus protein [Lymphocystis disease virus 1]
MNKHIPYENFCSKNIIFDKPKTNKYNGHRISLKYKQDETNTTKCYFRTPILASWGIQSYDKTDEDSPINYSFPLVLYNIDNGPTAKEQAFIDILQEILNKSKQHLKHKSVKEIINKRQLDSLVDDMSILYETSPKAPTIYPKIIYNNKTKQFVTLFYRRCAGKDRRIDPLHGRCRVIADIILESIYIGTTVSIQLKIMNVLLVEDLSLERDLVFSDISSEDAEEIKKYSEKEVVEDD